MDLQGIAVAVTVSRQWMASHSLEMSFERLVFWSMAFLTANAVLGVYRQLYTASGRYQTSRALQAFCWAGSTVLVWLRYQDVGVSWTQGVILLVVTAAALVVSRAAWEVVRRALQARGWALERTLVVLPSRGRDTTAWIDGLRMVGYDVRSVLYVDTVTGDLLPSIHREVQAIRARCVLIPSGTLAPTLMTYGDTHGLSIKLLSSEVQAVLACAAVHDLGGIAVVRPTRLRIGRLKAAAKRVLDVSIASLLLVITAPVFLVVAAAIKLESRGPLFFKQPRALSGNGPRFTFYKFRSMYIDADDARDRLRVERGIVGGLFKIRHDPRVTAVGRIIRRFSLDELPQLFNVLAGDMSLVGPRPLPADDYAGMSEHETIGGLCRRRSTVKPGLTGLWQICGRSDLGMFDMMLLDLYYIQNHTIFFDLAILFRTIPAVVIGRGAY